MAALNTGHRIKVICKEGCNGASPLFPSTAEPLITPCGRHILPPSPPPRPGSPPQQPFPPSLSRELRLPRSPCLHSWLPSPCRAPAGVGGLGGGRAALAPGVPGFRGLRLRAARRPEPVVCGGRLAASPPAARGCFWRYAYAQPSASSALLLGASRGQ